MGVDIRLLGPPQVVEDAGHLRVAGDGVRVDAVEILESLVPMERCGRSAGETCWRV